MRRQDNELETAETTDHRNRPNDFQMLEFSDTGCEILYFINSKVPFIAKKKKKDII